MLHVIHPHAPHKSTLSLTDILKHRLDFLKSEALASPHPEGKDMFDTSETLYLAYQTPAHGITGSARLLPKQALPADIAQGLPCNHEISFVLVDCLFHLSDKNGFYSLPDAPVQSQFSHMLDAYYTSLMMYLENLVLLDQTPVLYFYLGEEDFDLLSRHSGRDLFVLKEEIHDPEFENHYLGALDFSDLFYEAPSKKESPFQKVLMFQSLDALKRQ